MPIQNFGDSIRLYTPPCNDDAVTWLQNVAAKAFVNQYYNWAQWRQRRGGGLWKGPIPHPHGL